MRLSELGDSRTVRNLIEASRPGGMLAPVKEANRNIEEMRLLAERLTFMATRMQIMLNLQVEMASAKLAVQPEVRQLLEDSKTFAEVSDRAAEAFATLIADLPEERRAAIDQVFAGLSRERELFLADLGDEDGELRTALRDLQATLEAAEAAATQVDAAAHDLDAMFARVFAGSPDSPRPFDIFDYRDTFAELTTTVREVNEALRSVERILGSAETEGQLATIIDSANRLEDEVVDDILARAFLYGVALIVVFFVVLALYRLLMRRLAPEP
jgi:hypothetical protein